MSTPRRAFRPRVVEALEERVVMSRTTPFAAAFAAAHAVPTVRNTPPALGPIGTLGDSYSDEYRFYPPDRTFARNWVDVLHMNRKVSFGPFTGSNRGAPRWQGYAYNWAQNLATTESMVQDQLPGLARQVAYGQVRYANILVGGNDYLFFLQNVAKGLIPPDQIPATLAQVTGKAVANVQTAVGTLLAANPNVRVIVTTIDVSHLPAVVAQTGTPEGQQVVAATSLAVDQFNAAIRQIAAANPGRVALNDLAVSLQALANSPTGTINYGGQTIRLTTVGDEWHNFFLADGIHPGTVGQTLLANTIVQTIDANWGARLAPVTQFEGVRYARMVYNQSVHNGPYFWAR